MSEDTRQQLIDCLVEFTQRGEEPALTDASWVEDFGLNSLSLFHALLHIEQRFGVVFSEDETNLESIANFGEFVEMVDRLRCVVAGERSAPTDSV